MGNIIDRCNGCTIEVSYRSGNVVNYSSVTDIKNELDVVKMNIYLTKIENLDWLKPYLNLEEFSCNYCGLKSICGIENCTKLRYIDISNNLIQNISPLKNMLLLEYINIENNDIKHIVYLVNNSNIKHLICDVNKIDDYRDIMQLINLRKQLVESYSNITYIIDG